MCIADAQMENAFAGKPPAPSSKHLKANIGMVEDAAESPTVQVITSEPGDDDEGDNED